MIERYAQLLGRGLGAQSNPVQNRVRRNFAVLALKALEREEMDTSLDTCLGFSCN
jgi:hypothetical protein